MGGSLSQEGFSSKKQTGKKKKKSKRKLCVKQRSVRGLTVTGRKESLLSCLFYFMYFWEKSKSHRSCLFDKRFPASKLHFVQRGSVHNSYILEGLENYKAPVMPHFVTQWSTVEVKQGEKCKNAYCLNSMLTLFTFWVLMFCFLKYFKKKS